MKSLRDLYKIGPGPSSSHTLGPQKAALAFKEEVQAARYEVELLGSLSLTGKGHLTDYIIEKTLGKDITKVIFTSDTHPFHPNAMLFKGYDADDNLLKAQFYFSVGGGSVIKENEAQVGEVDVYPHNSFDEIKAYLSSEQIDLITYVDRYDSNQAYLNDTLHTMLAVVDTGLNKEGVLPGKLELKRVAKEMYQNALKQTSDDLKAKQLIMAYAYAASEENASGGTCVTAPTLGASGIIPALIYYYKHQKQISDEQLIDGLKVASIFGNLIKTNATISGAEGGCQAEVGAAVAMASAMVSYWLNSNLAAIEHAAEMGIEHHLGLTCDPVGGYVMIPCIERNVVGALRAQDNALLAQMLTPIKANIVSFDMVVKTMNYTGKKLCVTLKETSLGGLAIEVPVPSK